MADVILKVSIKATTNYYAFINQKTFLYAKENYSVTGEIFSVTKQIPSKGSLNLTSIMT